MDTPEPTSCVVCGGTWYAVFNGISYCGDHIKDGVQSQYLYAEEIEDRPPDKERR